MLFLMKWQVGCGGEQGKAFWGFNCIQVVPIHHDWKAFLRQRTTLAAVCVYASQVAESLPTVLEFLNTFEETQFPVLLDSRY